MSRRGSVALPILLGAGVVGAGLLLVAGRGERDTGGREPDDPSWEDYAMSGFLRDVLGPFFKWSEWTRTSTGLPNVPTDADKLRFQTLHDTVLDPLRRHLGVAVTISSGFRSDTVNNAVGGSSTSRHRTGEAVDIKVKGVSPEAVAATIRKLRLPVDQVIWYAGGWTHVGIRVAEGNRDEYRYSPSKGDYPLKTPNPALAV